MTGDDGDNTISESAPIADVGTDEPTGAAIAPHLQWFVTAAAPQRRFPLPPGSLPGGLPGDDPQAGPEALEPSTRTTTPHDQRRHAHGLPPPAACPALGGAPVRQIERIRGSGNPRLGQRREACQTHRGAKERLTVGQRNGVRWCERRLGCVRKDRRSAEGIGKRKDEQRAAVHLHADAREDRENAERIDPALLDRTTSKSSAVHPSNASEEIEPVWAAGNGAGLFARE